MKTFLNILLLIFCGCCPASEAQDLNKFVTTEERTVDKDPMKRYFVIRHQIPPAEAPKEYGLLIVVPGGAGGTNFLPFCANVITAQGTPKDFIVVELIAPIWGKQDDSTVIWPSNAFPVKNAQFNTETFLDAVIKDVSKLCKIHDGWVFTLGWSSSGHVLYSSSFENPKIRGSFVAMSRFQPEWFAHPENAKGKRYYFWHSPEDTICPYAESESAARFLTQQGASTVLKSYQGGHGWIPFTFYADRIKEGLEWFRAGEAEAGKMQTKLNAATVKNIKSY